MKLELGNLLGLEAFKHDPNDPRPDHPDKPLATTFNGIGDYTYIRRIANQIREDPKAQKILEQQGSLKVNIEGMIVHISPDNENSEPY